MRAKDLRIGNLVYQDGEFINGICSLSIYKFDFSQIYLSPIPLTGEWLIKLGFSDIGYRDGYIGIDHKAGGFTTDFVLRKPNLIDKIYFSYELPKYKYVELRFVHELQNLFFSLTGEELKVLK